MITRRYVLRNIILLSGVLSLITNQLNSSIQERIIFNQFKDKAMKEVNRSFIRIKEGLVHYRHSGNPDNHSMALHKC